MKLSGNDAKYAQGSRMRSMVRFRSLLLLSAALFAAAAWIRRKRPGLWSHVVRTCWVPAPPERVFGVVVDPRKPFLTDNPIVGMEVVGEQSEGVGTVYRWRFRLPLVRPFGFEEVVTTWEPGRRLAYEATTGWDMRAESSLAPEAGGTRLTFSICYRLPGSWALIPTWLAAIAIDRALANVARLAAGVEAGWLRVLTWQGDIAAAPERVFSVVADPESKRHWVEAIRRVVPYYEGTPHLGARYLASSGWGPFEFPFEEDITAWEEGRRVAYGGTSPFGQFRAEHYLTPTGTGTRLEYHMDYRFPCAHLAVLARPLLPLARRRVQDPSLRRLKALCEAKQ